MNIMSVFIPVAFLVYLILPTALLGLLEYFLARTESPWPGRVLPILSGVYYLFMALMVLLNLIAGASLLSLVLLPAGLLLLLNIPTAIFILIYRTTRKRRRQDRDIDKMNIQDL